MSLFKGRIVLEQISCTEVLHFKDIFITLQRNTIHLLMTLLSALNCEDILVDNQLTTNVRAHFWILRSSLYSCVSVPLLVPRGLGFCTRVISETNGEA